MTTALQLALKQGDKVFLNGAVLRVDRRVRIEILNDATILLGAHVLQADEATTPLRQLYFTLQSALMVPETAPEALNLARQIADNIGTATTDPELRDGLARVHQSLEAGRPYPALKIIRSLYGAEARLLDPGLEETGNAGSAIAAASRAPKHLERTFE